MKGDALVEQGSRRLEELAEASAARGGVAGRLAQPFAEDAAFLKKLKPSLIKARAKGDAPTDETAAKTMAPAVRRDDGHRSPLPLVGAALVAGVAVARVIDWRGHAHPRG
jgi:hypothetical protein